MINIIDLTSYETKNFPAILIDMMSTNSKKEDAKIGSSLVSLVKNDLSNLRTLTSTL